MVSKQLVVSAVVVLLLVQFTPARSSSTSWGFYCAGSNYTVGSQYDNLLAAVAADVPSKVASSPLLYTTETRGEKEAGAAVYVVAQCRGDSSSSTCRRCVSNTFKEAQRLCPFTEGAFVFLEWCTLGCYSKKLLPSPEDVTVDVTFAFKADESPISIHSVVYDATVLELASNVARGTAASPRHFGTGQKGFAGDEIQVEIYALAQCAPSISAQHCDGCLALLLEALVMFPNMTAGRAANLWCNYRFAPQHFFRGKPQILLGNTTTVTGTSYCMTTR